MRKRGRGEVESKAIGRTAAAPNAYQLVLAKNIQFLPQVPRSGASRRQVACNNCKRQKRMCSHQLPACLRCIRTGCGAQCRYGDEIVAPTEEQLQQANIKRKTDEEYGYFTAGQYDLATQRIRKRVRRSIELKTDASASQNESKTIGKKGAEEWRLEDLMPRVDEADEAEAEASPSPPEIKAEENEEEEEENEAEENEEEEEEDEADEPEAEAKKEENKAEAEAEAEEEKAAKSPAEQEEAEPDDELAWHVICDRWEDLQKTVPPPGEERRYLRGPPACAQCKFNRRKCSSELPGCEKCSVKGTGKLCLYKTGIPDFTDVSLGQQRLRWRYRRITQAKMTPERKLTWEECKTLSIQNLCVQGMLSLSHSPSLPLSFSPSLPLPLSL